MDMNKLHYFCTVYQAGSLTKASELLHISQPALSKAIKNLEQQLEKKLLIPSGRGIAITDDGKQIADQAIPLLQQINNLTAPNNTKESVESLSIATFEVFSTYFLSKVISESFKNHNIKILEFGPGPMEDAVLSRKADIGITYLPIPNKDLDFLKITSVEMGLFGLKSKFKNYSIESVPFTAPLSEVSGTPSKVKGVDGWPDHIIPRNIKYSVAMMETALDLCRRGCCIGYFPKFVIDLHNEVCKTNHRLEILKSPSKLKKTKFDVYMIKRKTDMETSNFKKISRALRKTLT